MFVCLSCVSVSSKNGFFYLVTKQDFKKLFKINIKTFPSNGRQNYPQQCE